MSTVTRLWPLSMLLLALAFPLGWLALSSETSENASPISIAEYEELMAFEVTDLEDLGDLIRDQRAMYELITPPGSSIIIKQPLFPVIPFQWKHFPKDLLDLLGDRYEYEYSVPVYKLHVVEDRSSRALHFHDLAGDKLSG